MQGAVGVLFGVQSFQFSACASFCAQGVGLLLTAVDPNDLLGLNQIGHFLDPVQNVLVVGHDFLLLFYVELFKKQIYRRQATLSPSIYFTILLFFFQ
jgi:hypothetical protein